jgi:ABC-type nitrate/sulfonate/bicarbonate transport system substrate-binding protein
VVIASERTLRDKPELTRRFLAALTAAHEYVVVNPKHAARVLAAAVPELDADELGASVPWVAQRMMMGKPWGYQEYAVWEEYGRWMSEVGVLDQAFDPAGAFSTEFLPVP